MGRWSMYIIAPPLSLASSGNRNLGKIKHQKTCFDLFCSHCRISVKGLYHSFHFSLIFLPFWCPALVFFVVQRPRGSCRKRMGPRRTSMWSSRATATLRSGQLKPVSVACQISTPHRSFQLMVEGELELVKVGCANETCWRAGGWLKIQERAVKWAVTSWWW